VGGFYPFRWNVTVHYRTEKGRFEHKLVLDNLAELDSYIEPLLYASIDKIDVVPNIAGAGVAPIELTSPQVEALEKVWGQADF
jgi:hypothetical protein